MSHPAVPHLRAPYRTVKVNSKVNIRLHTEEAKPGEVHVLAWAYHHSSKGAKPPTTTVYEGFLSKKNQTLSFRPTRKGEHTIVIVSTKPALLPPAKTRGKTKVEGFAYHTLTILAQ